MRRSDLTRVCALGAAAALATAGCGTGGSASAPGGGAAAAPAAVTATVSALASTRSGVVPVSYALEAGAQLPADATASVRVEYSLNGGLTFRTATQGAGGAAAQDRPLARPGGAPQPQVFAWDSVADGVALAAAQDVVVRVTPLFDGRAGTPATRTLSVDNRPAQDVLVVSEDVNEDGFPDLVTLSTAHDPMRIVSVQLHSGRASGLNNPNGGGGGGGSNAPRAFVDATSSMTGMTLDPAVSRALAAAARHPRRTGAARGLTPVRVRDPSQGNRERFFVIIGR